MTKDRLLDQLRETLCLFDDERTIVSMHLTFSHAGCGNRTHREELWWDENLMMFIPTEPE